MRQITGYYIGWVGMNNLGDEVMWNAFRSVITAGTWRAINPHKYSDSWREWFQVKAGRSKDNVAVVLGGGTLINSHSTQWLATYLEAKRTLGRSIYLFGTGVHAPSAFAGCRSWRDSRRTWVTLLRDLPVIAVRGPLSKALLEESGAANVLVIGDPVVLLHQDYEPTVFSYIEGTGPAKIGINIGRGASGTPMEIAAKTAINAFMILIPLLIKLGFEIDIFAVWPEDLGVAESVATTLGVKEPVKLLSNEVNAFEYFLRHDLIISFKLHAAILAFAQNTPVIMFEYTSKCEDFRKSIKWRYSVPCSGERPIDCSEIIHMATDILNGQEALRFEISNSMAILRKEFIKYCRIWEDEIASS